MKGFKFCILSLAIVTLWACNGKGNQGGGNDYRFTITVMHKTTPVKDQGHSNACWAYAMLSMMESEHLRVGDSVNLSPAYVERMRMNEDAEKYYLAAGHSRFLTRGTGMTLIHAIMCYGLMPYDSYRDNADIDDKVAGRRLAVAGNTAINNRVGLANWKDKTDEILDDAYGPLPRCVFMLGAQYTPLEFAHSVCREDEYTALTSFTHHPFYSKFELEVPDNWEHDDFYNIPIDKLTLLVVNALQSGHTAVWEGDTSEPGFSFEKGVAIIGDGKPVNQTERQKEFERLETSDNHAMHIIGLAKDQYGKGYFIMKNSWGTNNPYHGLMYMSGDYFKMKTIAVFIPSACI
jgi:aminopeptidase C